MACLHGRPNTRPQDLQQCSEGLGLCLALYSSLWLGSLCYPSSKTYTCAASWCFGCDEVKCSSWHCCACLPLGVAFPPLSCSLLIFANSPVTKGCAGSELTTLCGICAGVLSPGLQASSFLFLPAVRMCTASKKQEKAAFLETRVSFFCAAALVSLLALNYLSQESQ